MITIEEYKRNPCRLSSIPYWKIQSFNIPDNIKVVHEEEYTNNLNSNEIDTLYFRLKHDLDNISEAYLQDGLSYKLVDTENIDELLDVVNIINNSYENIKVNISQVKSWIELEVFRKDLWIFIYDNKLHKNIALGIGEFHEATKEGILDWIQVLPDYRGMGIGQGIVNKLLTTMKSYADFATVSGEVNNKTNPEKLYKTCGFTGNDIWHVIVTK